MSEDVVIESLGSGGSGVTHLADGMIVFVPRTAPGDRVRLGEVRRHKRHALASAAELLAGGPDRVAPPCVHYLRDHCGGCQWQHIGYPAQLAAKSRIIGDALRRIGKFDLADPPVIASPREFGYRTVVTLTVREKNRRVYAGFHDYRDPDVVFPLEFCHIARPEVMDRYRAADLIEAPPGGDVRMRITLEGVTYQGGSFQQVNEEVSRQLQERVVEQVLECDGRKVLDLYAGAGRTAIPVARAGKEVTMVELDHQAVKQAEQSGVRLKRIVGRVEDHIAHLLPADIVVVNPPRTGLDEAVAERLNASTPQRLVYVSCDPATLARDLKRIGMPLRSVTGFDMFPQTSHVETLAVCG